MPLPVNISFEVDNAKCTEIIKVKDEKRSSDKHVHKDNKKYCHNMNLS